MPPLALIRWFKLHAIPLDLGLLEIKLQPFGLLVATAVAVGFRLARARARSLGIGDQDFGEFVFQTTTIGLVGAYFLNAAMYTPEVYIDVWHDPRILARRWLGLSSYGGFVTGLGVALVFAHRRRLSLLSLGDAWCYGIPFAWIFARLGCFVVHDHPGVVSDFLLAVDNYDGFGRSRHDLGLYEVLWSLVVAPAFYVLERRPRARGLYVALIPLLYGPVRFLLDFLRVPAVAGGDARYLGLTPAQYFSVALTLAGFVLLMWHRRHSQTRDSAAR